MIIIDTLIYDRTAEDLARVVYLNGLWNAETGAWEGTTAERAEWLSGLKGAYNFTDLNRVGEAVAYLAGVFRGYGYAVTVTPKTDWEVEGIPSSGQMAAYLADVTALRGVVTMLESTPPVPESMAALTWAKANDIERILADIDDSLNRMARSWFYSGEIYSGEF